MPGNVVKHKDVTFEIFQHLNHVRAIPLCNEHTRRILNLPAEIVFHLVGDVVIGARPALRNVSRKIAEALSSTQRVLLC